MNKVGIIGDVHANLAAFEAVLQALADKDCDTLICTGDIVGYGPSPAECIAIIRERGIPCVLGNHDHYVTLLTDPRLEKLRPDVMISVEWTQNALDMNALRWLSQLPKRLDFAGFSVVHGSFGPKPWRYLTDAESFRKNFKYQDVQLGFCGHSHIPMFAHARDDAMPFVSYLRSARLPADVPTMINVGSAGQPRDHDPRAAGIVFDPVKREVDLVRVPYDIAATQDLMRRAGLPEKTIARLAEGR